MKRTYIQPAIYTHKVVTENLMLGVSNGPATVSEVYVRQEQEWNMFDE